MRKYIGEDIEIGWMNSQKRYQYSIVTNIDGGASGKNYSGRQSMNKKEQKVDKIGNWQKNEIGNNRGKTSR